MKHIFHFLGDKLRKKEGKGREGKGREGKGREGKGREKKREKKRKEKRKNLLWNDVAKCCNSRKHKGCGILSPKRHLISGWFLGSE